MSCSSKNKNCDNKQTPGDVAYKAKSEKYAKIISKTLIYGDGDASAYGQNAFFYDSAEGLLTSVILLIAEFAEPGERHIVSVFKLIQELMAPSGVKGRNHFQLLMDRLPADHKARWFSGAALSAGDQAMASVMSTAMSRLNAFLDSEMEQVLCFDTAIDARNSAMRNPPSSSCFRRKIPTPILSSPCSSSSSTGRYWRLPMRTAESC